MDKKYRLLLSGVWMVSIVIISVWFLSLFKETNNYQLAILLWAFAFLGGLCFKSYCNLVVEKIK